MASYKSGKSVGKFGSKGLEKAVMPKAPSSPQEALERVFAEGRSPWPDEISEDEDAGDAGDPTFGSCTDAAHKGRWAQVIASASNDMGKFVVAAAEHIASTPEAYASFEAAHRRAVVRSVGSIISGSAAESDVEPAALLGLSSMDPGVLRVAVKVAALLRKNKIELTQEDVEEAVRLAGVEAVLKS